MGFAIVLALIVGTVLLMANWDNPRLSAGRLFWGGVKFLMLFMAAGGAVWFVWVLATNN